MKKTKKTQIFVGNMEKCLFRFFFLKFTYSLIFEKVIVTVFENIVP